LRLSTNSSRLLRQVTADTSGSLGLTRWLLKPPESLAMQTQESKVKVVSSSGTTLVKLSVAIEFAGGSLMSTPTWRACCRCLAINPTEGYPKIVDL
jgi:hypothetical protein